MGKRKILLGIFLILLFLIAFFFFKNNEPEPTAEAAVVMTSEAFEPSDLKIKKNTKVTFKNEDTKLRWPASDLHPTHGIFPEFDPLKPLNPGESWEFVFDKVGKWKYHDHLIPSLRATIEVTE